MERWENPPQLQVAGHGEDLNFARKKFGTLFDFSAKLAGWKKFLAGNFQTKS
jgi:hypothetical protein